MPPTPTDTPSATVQTIEVRVAQSVDDAEERSSGSMYITSSDLELIDDKGRIQTVGMRFQNVTVPASATIITAYVEFEADDTASGDTSLTFHGEADPNPAVFTGSAYNITDRSATAAGVDWNNVPPWNTVSEKHKTPDLAPIVQEIIGQPGWNSGNALVLLVSGSGVRTAEAFDGESQNAPLLHVEYTTGAP